MRILIFISIVCVLGVTAVVDLKFDWMYLVKYGQDAHLKPLQPEGENSSYVFVFNEDDCVWLTPEMMRLSKNNNPRPDKYEINFSVCNLTVKNVQKEDNGIYHVYLNSSYVTKAMLNYHGPPKESFIEEYGTNLIAGFSTAGGVLAIFIFIYFLRMFSYSNRNKKVAVDTRM